jgi:carbamoyl-phosphate synthase small subunit
VSRPNSDAKLLLNDGSVFSGTPFGSERTVAGEVVFNTGMVGYLESMTDPSYAGQLLCFTYPLIGNYGVPSKDSLDRYGLPSQFESGSVKVRGIVVQEACDSPSHWSSARTLHEWLQDEGVPGIAGVDTRALVSKLRESGVMMGVLSNDGQDIGELQSLLARAESYDTMKLVAGVSIRRPVVHGSGDRTVAILDCGVKFGIVRNLLQRGYRVVRLPFDSTYADVMKHDPAGVVVSNGPGDPVHCGDAVKCTSRLVDGGVPVLGICLGEQVVGISQGARTFKLKYGHRGQNKPCVDVTTLRGYVTSQNHGYALDPDSVKKTELQVWFVNADDHTIEGVTHKSRPCLAVQFHPEASPGPYDTGFVFDRFGALMGENGGNIKGEAIRSMRA